MRISEGQIIPWGYAIAFVDVCRDVKMAYPLGLHWLVRQWHNLESWRLPYKWTPSERELSLRIKERLEDARHRARGDGYRQGFEEGKDHAWRQWQATQDAAVQRFIEDHGYDPFAAQTCAKDAAPSAKDHETELAETETQTEQDTLAYAEKEKKG